MNKKICATLLLIIILFQNCSYVFAQDEAYSGTCGENITWELDSEGVLTISGTGDMYDYQFSSLNGTILHPSWYDYIGKIKKVVINEGVTSIGNYAFTYAKNLSNVTLPSTLIGIGQNAFSDCEKLTNIELPSALTNIGANAFRDCTSLSYIKIPKNTIQFGQRVFKGCNLLQTAGEVGTNCDIEFEWKDTIPENVFHESMLISIVIPDNIEEIGESAFWNCDSLKDVQMSNSIATIKNSAFYECDSIEKVILPQNLKTIEDYAFRYCDSLKDIIFPENIKNIEKSVFEGSKIEEIIIPSSIIFIEKYAFYNCKDLKKIKFLGTEAPMLGDGCFLNVNATVYYRYGCEKNFNETVFKNTNGNFIFKPYEDGNPIKLEINEESTQTQYITNSSLNISNISLKAIYESGFVEDVEAESIEVGSYDFSIIGKKQIELTYKGQKATLEVYVHDAKNVIVDTSEYPESTHNYENSLDQIYTYTNSSAYSITATFSAETKVEKNIDFIEVYDQKDNLIARHTGTEAASQTITLEGSVLKIRLISDEVTSYYGFSFDSIIIKQIEHIYDEGNVTKEPTCGEEGEKTYTCTICKCTKTENLPLLEEHTPAKEAVIENKVEPTYTEEGSYDEVIYCSVCGKELSRKTNKIEKLNIEGDINADGKLNARDAKLALQYYTGSVTLTEEEKARADINQDGKVNARDAKLILQHYTGQV